MGKPPGFCIGLFLLWSAAIQAYGQGGGNTRQVNVGVYLSPPFVMQEGEKLSGMSVELWENISQKQNLSSQYRVYKDIKSLVDGVHRGEIDVAVTNLTITEARARKIDFTQPWFDAGLRVMVGKKRRTSISDILQGLKKTGMLASYLWILGVIVLATLAFTLFYRKFDREFPRRWRDGLAESFYSVMSIATSGNAQRKNLFGWVGKIWAGIWLVCGVAVVSFITASITSVMTSLALTSQINGLRDLPGKTVGVLAGSVAEEYIRENGISTHGFDSTEQAVAALHAGEVDAIVGDSPVLAYFAFNNPELGLRLVGKLFNPDKYAFAVPKGSSLARPLSIEIIAAHEQGLIMDLREDYFGTVK
ncbi:transporter substrate-binding domain-containing protein [Microbulbifer elongatus]|uniref:transporter substrate-binding domain-containing protein n=1 Tax=Microbulbifer elongatus TaxID=86173 RepID=UPI001E291C9A|nr:transporter substrate-binding domain-containing protein [Microbulbifer elongatus]